MLPPRSRPLAVHPLPLLLLLAGLLACASTGDSDAEDAGDLPPVSASSPWRGLGPEEAVDRFLELSVPYDISNTHLIDNLAGSYGGGLATALGARLDAMPADSASDADLDLERFLLVRTGCRWANRYRDDAVGVEVDEELRARRRDLLRHLGDAIGRVRDPLYRSWLDNVEEDRECLHAIEALPRDPVEATAPSAG
jgi:hypothetical protein